jgi:hypothetical protein
VTAVRRTRPRRPWSKRSKGTGQNRVILHVNGPNELQSLGLPWQAFFITTNDIGT